jgi:hypothetical protein
MGVPLESTTIVLTDAKMAVQMHSPRLFVWAHPRSARQRR